MTASLCFHVFVYPCCLKAWYKSKFKIKRRLHLINVIAYHRFIIFNYLLFSHIFCFYYSTFIFYILLFSRTFYRKSLDVSFLLIKLNTVYRECNHILVKYIFLSFLNLAFVHFPGFYLESKLFILNLFLWIKIISILILIEYHLMFILILIILFIFFWRTCYQVYDNNWPLLAIK